MIAVRTIAVLIASALCTHAQAYTIRAGKPCRADSGIDLKITLDGTPVYHGVLAACPEMLPDSLRDHYTRATFVFRPARSLDWDDVRTPARERIEGNVWRAGADSDDVLLGISFVARDRVLLNTIHIAALDSSTAYPLGVGIRSVTLPNKRLKLAARVNQGMNLSSARRSLSAVR
jgi:hypothetical protein